jgi:hypothetical protein
MLEECNDLNNCWFGLRSESAIGALSDEVCERALKNRDDMSLLLQMNFVLRLTSVPSDSDISSPSWQQTRSDRVSLLLETTEDISDELAALGNVQPTMPTLPDQKYMNSKAVGASAIDPSGITDPVMLKKYKDGWKQYYQDLAICTQKSELNVLLPVFQSQMAKFFSSAYTTSPSDTKELQRLFLNYKIDTSDQSLILQAVNRKNQSPTP